MGINELMQTSEQHLPPELYQQITAGFNQLMQGMADMASLLCTTNERMGMLEKEVYRLTKVTPAQAKSINAAVKLRAETLCQQHRAAGCEKAVANAIRKALKLGCGVSNIRELPRGDYALALQRIELWDDYRLIRAIKAKETAK